MAFSGVKMFPLILLPLVTAFASYPSAEANLSPIQDVTPLLRIEYGTEVYTRAQDYLDSLRGKPICHQIAASDLIKSCEKLNDANNNVNVDDFQLIRDAAKAEFNIRLAICEMHDAQAQLPKDCVRFLPTVKACSSSTSWPFKKRQNRRTDTPCYPHSDAAQIRQCLAALWAGPQSWTSYSNAQQNAVLVCRATHEVREKERLIDLLTSAAEVNGELATANEEAIKRQQAAQEAFDRALTTFDAEIAAHVDKLNVQSSSVVGTIFEAAQAAITHIYQSGSEATRLMTSLKKDLQESHETTLQLQEATNQMHETNQQIQTNLIAEHNSHMQSAQAYLEQIKLAVHQIISDELDTAEKLVDQVHEGAQQAALSLTRFNDGLSESQEILEQHITYAREQYSKLQHIMAAFSTYNLLQGLGLLLGLIATHTILQMTIGTASAMLFACVFAAVSATCVFGPPFIDAFQDWDALQDAVWNFHRVCSYAPAAVVASAVLFTLASKLRSGHATRPLQTHEEVLSPTLPTTAPVLYNPASPAYNP